MLQGIPLQSSLMLPVKVNSTLYRRAPESCCVWVDQPIGKTRSKLLEGYDEKWLTLVTDF
jgi:hypothetical protein